MKGKPENGGIVVFCNRSRNRIIILFFDDTGCWVSTKRLDQKPFSWPQEGDLDNRKNGATKETSAREKNRTEEALQIAMGLALKMHNSERRDNGYDSCGYSIS